MLLANFGPSLQLGNKKVLIPLPRIHFDPSEVAIPWRVLKKHGLEPIFATPDGQTANCDRRMLEGHGLGLLKSLLAANETAVRAYQEMETSPEFCQPLRWDSISSQNFSALLLPGGHDKGVREYLESSILQKCVADFFAAEKIVAAICHGVVLAARSPRADGKSVLYGKKTTALLARQEMLAWNLTRWWLGDYYRTYPQTVEDEVRSVLENKNDFYQGPVPLQRDTESNLDRGFVVEDGNYISARWPGDAHRFAFALASKVLQTDT